jgi:cell division protein FtsL
MQQPASPEYRRWANQPVAREVDRDRAQWIWGLFLALLLAAAPFAVYMLEQNECLRLSYKVSALEQERERLIEIERRLRMERAARQRLATIEAWALERRGLVHPTRDQVVVVHRSPNATAAN